MNFIDTTNLEPVDDADLKSVLELVCSLFGEVDRRVIIEGAYFGELRYPHTIYRSADDPFHVAICIPKHQASDPLARLVHLSHELVHCLQPNGWPPQATILEEGLAEHSKIYISQSYYQDQLPDYDFCNLSSGKYREAFDEIENLIYYEGLEGMRSGIRAIRKRTGLPFCQIKETDLAREFLKTPSDILAHLSQPFNG